MTIQAPNRQPKPSKTVKTHTHFDKQTGTIESQLPSQSRGTFPKPCFFAEASIPRGNGLFPQSTFGRVLRTRFFTTFATGGINTTETPGCRNRGSIPNIRHNGRKIRIA